MKVELNKEQVSGLLEIVNKSQINGSSAQFVLGLQVASTNALKSETLTPVKKEEVKKDK